MLDRGTDVLLYMILDHLVDHYQPILDYLQDALDDLEDRALSKPRPEVLTEISFKKRELLNLRRIVAPQREVVAQLTRGDVPFIREGTRVFLRDVQDHLIRTVESVELYRDLVLGARDIYLSSISNNLNQIMKVLTIITVVALPATIVTSFFGMNFNSDPNTGVPGWRWILNHPAGFWLALVFILLLVGGLLFMFWRNRWLGSAAHIEAGEHADREARASRAAARLPSELDLGPSAVGPSKASADAGVLGAAAATSRDALHDHEKMN
jgi:magnesium transporter